MKYNKENIELLLDKTRKDKSINEFYRNSFKRNEPRKENWSLGNYITYKKIFFSSKDEKEVSNSILSMENIYNNKINIWK